MKSSKTTSDYSHLYPKTFDHSPPQTNTITNSHTTTTTTNSFYYKPTSVLDPHLPPPSDDWDSVSWLLTDADITFDHLTDFDYQQHSDENTNTNTNTDIITFDRSHLDLLLRAATCLESNDLVTAHLILARLNYAFPSFPPPSSPPIHRVAFHFRDALLSLLPNPPTPIPTRNRPPNHRTKSLLQPLPHPTVHQLHCQPNPTRIPPPPP